MQAQTTQTINTTQSIAYVKTLLQAGLGCITYLRNLLPADNFTDTYLTCENQSVSQSFDASGGGSKRITSNVRLMSLNRGFTEEADRLLDYLEQGIFDALEKQYLRRFMFVIYLDSKDPNNIVEAYTFNFHYHTLPGTDTVVPIMSLGEDMMRMSLKPSSRGVDPAAEASKKGKVPTLGEVQKSLKQLIKTLIQATSHMESLPKRRYATFKLFYTDKTPADYEPQHFRSGDSEKDKFFFTTHRIQEIPEKFSVGSLETGRHGVNVGIQSIVAYLPSSENNDAIFTGTISTAAIPSLTPLQEASHRVQQAELQTTDALNRTIVWNAEDGLGDPDAEGEDDPDYADGIYKNVNDSGVEIYVPIGIRNEEGVIEPLPAQQRHGGELTQMGRMDVDNAPEEALFGGLSEYVPPRAGELSASDAPVMELSQTQQIETTQEINTANSSSSASRSSSNLPKIATSFALKSKQSLPSSSIDPTTQSSISGIDTQMLMNLALGSDSVEGTNDTEMLDMETQITPLVQAEEPDPIESYASGVQDASDDIDYGLDCNCGVTIEDDCCWCDAGCGRWYHVWCMGYHSFDDKRIPLAFTCFRCRVRKDKNYAMIAVNDLLPNMMSKFDDLALFRRSIKIAEESNPDTLAKFTKYLGCEVTVAGQLFKRLETEGFIALETVVTDDTGLLSTRTRSVKGKRKAKGGRKVRKEIQKTKYSFVKSSTRTAAYSDYFNPNIDVESRMMGLSAADVRPRMHRMKDAPTPTTSPSVVPVIDPAPVADARHSLAPAPSTSLISPPGFQDSQTQNETQFVALLSPTEPHTQDENQTTALYHPVSVLKRKSTTTNTESRPNKKKIKISMGPAVDLQD